MHLFAHVIRNPFVEVHLESAASESQHFSFDVIEGRGGESGLGTTPRPIKI